MNVSFAEDMRRIDETVERDYGLPALALMENAGRRSAEEAAAMIGGAVNKVFAVFAGGEQRWGCVCCGTPSDEYGCAREAVFYGRKRSSRRSGACDA